MIVTVLTDNNQIGKTLQASKHPSRGVIDNKHFTSAEEFKSIITDLTSHQCFTVGLYSDGYKYVPSSDTNALSLPKCITRTKNKAVPGHIFVIDCDHPKFAGLRGPNLHTFLATQLPDIFSGATYLTTKSTSSYIKGHAKFHQYYFFSKPSDMKMLNTLIDRIFKNNNMITYGLAKNYSRSYIYTPIDTKLHELQQPIFEMSTDRLHTLGIEAKLEIDTYPGHVIDVSAMTLPNPDLPEVKHNYDMIKTLAEEDRSAKLAEYCKEHGVTAASGSSLERGVLPPSMVLYAQVYGEKQNRLQTSLLDEITHFIKTQTIPKDLYYAVGEPEYAAHQTSKLFHNTPFDLASYRLYDQAHGGINYIPVFNYDEMYTVLTLAQQHVKNPKHFMQLATARSDMNPEEIEILANLFRKSAGVSTSKLAGFMSGAANLDLQHIEEQLHSLTEEDLASLLASIEGNTHISMSRQTRSLLERGALDTQLLFRAENVEILRDIVARSGTDIITKPGPLNEFNVATKRQTMKLLAQVYPLTNISPKANEVTMDAMIDKFTADKQIEAITYRASLHGEKLYFSDNMMEITYQQPRPTFQNVSDPVKYILDGMSHAQETEFRDMYINQSIGDIWPYIAELVYIKKVYPELKKDFLWLHLGSNVGKTYNMDAANVIAPYDKISLNQLLEQASKVIPSVIAKSSFLFHDEVKHFNHNWNELGAMHSIKGMHANATLTQLPLKILASAENTMSKGTKQQLNRLLVYKSNAKQRFEDLVEPKYKAAFGALTHKVIYEEMTKAYDTYSRLPQNEALQKAIITSSSLAAQLAPKDMMVTEDVVRDAITGYLLQEYGSQHTHPDDRLARYIKHTPIKDGVLYVNFKKVDAPAFIEHVLRVTTSSIESKSMNYEALSITWEDLGAYDVTTSRTIGGVSGIYGRVLEIQIPKEIK